MNPQSMKDVADVAAVGGASGAYLGWLPEIAALFAIIWTGIRIFEWAEARFFKKGQSDIRKD